MNKNNYHHTDLNSNQITLMKKQLINDIDIIFRSYKQGNPPT